MSKNKSEQHAATKAAPVAAPAPAAPPAPVGDPGGLIDHVYRLIAALRTRNFGEALRLVADILQHAAADWSNLPPWPQATEAGPGTDAAGLASALERVVSEAGGQPAQPKDHPQAAAVVVPWAGLLPLVVRAAEVSVRQKA